MIVIPAIDIKGGKCVRLLQGDPDKETVYSDSPADMARRFQDLGAKLIHVVDLDGAFEGRPVNLDIVSKIVSSVSVPVEIGGGIRTQETIRIYLNEGIKRIIIGSAVLDDSFSEMAALYHENLVAGIDAKDGMVAVRGWKDVSSIKSDDAIAKVMSLGIKDVIHTDISTDGMLEGPNLSAYRHIMDRFPGIRLTASGGVSSEKDLRALEEINVWGAVTGKAVYDGRINLGQVLKQF